MSLILEALRKSEAEREIGRVPGLRSQTLPLDDPEPAPRAASTLPAWGWMTIGGLAALLAVAVAWGLSGTRPSAPRPAVAAAPESIALAPAIPPPAATPVAAPPRPDATEADSPQPLRWGAEDRARPPARPAPTRSAAARAPVVAKAPASSPPPPRTAMPDAARRAANPVPPGSATAAAAVAPSASPPAYEQLPEDVRRRLPAVTVEGSAFSADPASRMLIVNGQVVREGDTLSNGVVLETIQLRSAVLRAGDVRYRIGY